MQVITETKQTSLDELSRRRRAILARCYEIVLSPNWGVTDGGQSAVANEAGQAQATTQETAESESQTEQ